EGSRLQPTSADFDLLNASTEELLRLIDGHRSAFEQAHGLRATSFMAHAIENLRGDGRGKSEIIPEGAGRVAALRNEVTTYFNDRDALNARNLQWLIERGYPGQKVIVWAHNVHIANAYFRPEFESAHLVRQQPGMKPMGVYLAESLGD